MRIFHNTIVLSNTPVARIQRFVSVVLMGVATPLASLYAGSQVMPHFNVSAARSVVVGSSGSQPQFGSVQGVVFDSLLLEPIAGATVTVVGTLRTTTTDQSGRFTFDSVSVGLQTFAFSSAQTDALKFGTMGDTITVQAKPRVRLRLFTPSLRAVWRARCNDSNTVGSDSGVVWGTLQNAATDANVPTGMLMMSWFNVRADIARRMNLHERRVQLMSDENGQYVACGFPTDAEIESEAFDSTSASDRIAFTIGPHRIFRVDLLVSVDMGGAPSPTTHGVDSPPQLRHGSSILRGVVRNDDGSPVDDTMVIVRSSDSRARTNAEGRFAFVGQPAGTQALRVRQIGKREVVQRVDLRPNRTTNVSVRFDGIITLATKNVVAKSAVRLEYEDRRARKLGSAMDTTVLNHRSDLYSVLQNVPLLQLRTTPAGKKQLLLRSLNTLQRCNAQIYVDGHPSLLEAIDNLSPSSFRAIEILSPELLPAKYMSNPPGCGAILIWTVNARW